jgi:MoxR-like ATPase
MVEDRVDLSQKFSMEVYQQLPEQQLIENPEIEPVPQKLTEAHKRPVKREVYRASKELVDAVNLAIALGRPLLVQGEPGCGKTRLAYAVAYVLGMPLEVAPIKSTSRAQDLLYIYDAVRRLYDAQFPPKWPSAGHRPPSIWHHLRMGAGDDSHPAGGALPIQRYIKLGPLGRAIARAQYGRRRSVVLIDEIDKADLDFPNDLLWELDRLEFRIPEADISYAVDDHRLRPIVLVTHNEEKALPSAFLRRCIFHYIAFPQEPDALWRIIAAHNVADEKLGRRAIDVLLNLRKIKDLTKNPGISELLDWVGYLSAVNTPVEELDKLPYIGALLKQAADQDRAKQERQVR